MCGLTWATTVSQESDQSRKRICGGKFQPVRRWCFSTSFRYLSGLKASGRPPRSQLLPESHTEQALCYYTTATQPLLELCLGDQYISANIQHPTTRTGIEKDYIKIFAGTANTERIEQAAQPISMQQKHNAQ